MNIGMYLSPSFALPFFIVAIITAEKNDVVIKDTIANILKSAYCMPLPEKESPNPPCEATPPKLDPRLVRTCINTPESASSTGAAAIVANDMNMT